MKSNIFTNLYQYFILNSKCPSKNHFGTSIYFCSEQSCNKGYICSQCLKEDTEHFSQHVKYFIPLDSKKNFFSCLGLENSDININDFDFNYLKNPKILSQNKKICDGNNFYENIKEYIMNIFSDNTKNNFFENKNIIENYIVKNKEKEKKLNEFINNKINGFINKNDKYKINELIEQIKPYVNYLNEKNKTKEFNEKNKSEKIISFLNEEIPKLITQCINIYTEPEKDEINIEFDKLKETINTPEKNNSFYEGSINNISCIKMENNFEPEEFESKININVNNVNNQNIIKLSSLNDSFFKKIEDDSENKIDETRIKNKINKLPFNNYEYQQKENLLFNNREKEKSKFDGFFNNIPEKATIAEPNNFQYYNSNTDLISELEIKLNRIHNKDSFNNFLKINTPKSNNNKSAINISINNFQKRNSNNINNININNIYQSQRERKDNNIIINEDDNLNKKTKNNIIRLNKLKQQIGNLIK